jgi:exonuclease I
MPATIKKQLIQEIEDLPDELQEKMLKMVHFMKKEILAPKKKITKKANALLDVDKITIDTGIADLSSQHDHYLYDVPKK